MADKLTFELQIGKGLWLSRNDFGCHLIDEVAFDIAFLVGMNFGSKEDALIAYL